MHETISAPLAAPSAAPAPVASGWRATIWKTLVMSAVLALVAPAVGCDDGDDGGGATDAGGDAAAQVACKPADCANIALPRIPCDNGGMLSATCARGTDMRCTWTQSRCSAPGSDAASDLGRPDVNQDVNNDGGAPDATDAAETGETGDAVDGPSNLDAVAG